MSSKPVAKPAAKPVEKRRYNSTRRTAQAAQTRADVLTAAVECFSESGWAGTTLAAIAERADVAVETVYGGFGSKKQLLRGAFEIAVVGDAEPIPLVDRPEWADMHAGTRAQRIAKAIALNAEIHVRSARVWRAILESSTADAEMAAWRDELESNRHHDTSLGLEIALGKPLRGPMLEVVFALLGPESYLTLTEGRGFTRAQYEAAMADAVVKLAG